MIKKGEMTHMTPTEKGKITRRENKAKRDAYWRTYWAQEEVDKTAAIEAMRRVRDDESSTPAERLEAVKIIEYAMGYHHIPYEIKCPQKPTDGAIEQEKEMGTA